MTPFSDMPQDNSQNEQQRVKRHEFYDRVLGAQRGAPVKILPMLCEAWKMVTDAAFVWLLLYNKAAQQWEVAAYSPSDSCHYAPQSYESLHKDGHESVAEYASTYNKIVHVPDLEWFASADGRKFRVVCCQELLRLGCESFVCIPLVMPEEQVDSQPIRGAICVKYKTSLPMLQPDSSFLLMARLTAAKIFDSYQAEQQKILIQLNVLAEKYLTRRTRSPEKQRHKYCEEIIVLIQEHLRVNWVSIFYQNESRDMIHCIATSGLWGRSGIAINKAAPADACYSPNQSLTGKVFATCEPFFSQIGKMPPRGDIYPKYVFRETPVENEDESQLPWIIYPIKQPVSQVRKNHSSYALGVIRCVGNKAWFVNDKPRNFDPIQIQTLEFIARQLAPVLETMAVHIERERAVTIIKHDLFAPLRMIDDEVSEIMQSIERGAPLNAYSLPNLSASTMIAKNLVDSLDADPEEALRAYDPQPTGLEGDIVARVKNMLSHYAYNANRIKIVFEPIRETIPKLYIDRGLTERVFCNLILNAIKYGKRNSAIKVSARSDAANYYLEVTNEGIGVDPSEEKQIFRGRYRGLAARRSGKNGLGLGLKISRAAMEKQKGGLLLISAKKEATVFAIQFPKKLQIS